MTETMQKHIEDFERNVNEIREKIAEARMKLNSTDWNNEPLRDAYERAISIQEGQLEIAIQYHNVILELSRTG